MQETKVGLIVMKDGKGKKKDVVEVDNVEDGMEERATRGRTKGKGFSLFINQVVLTRQERRTNWRRRQNDDPEMFASGEKLYSVQRVKCFVV